MKVIHTKTQEQFNRVLEIFEKKGWKWGDGDKPSSHIYHWNDFREDTSIEYENNFSFGYISEEDEIISFEEFLRLEGIVENKLPQYWCVKNDGSQLFKDTVIKYLTKIHNGWTGSCYAYYGYDGSEQYSGTYGHKRFDDFKNNPTLLTIKQFIKMTTEKIEYKFKVGDKVKSKEYPKFGIGIIIKYDNSDIMPYYVQYNDRVRPFREYEENLELIEPTEEYTRGELVQVNDDDRYAWVKLIFFGKDGMEYLCFSSSEDYRTYLNDKGNGFKLLSYKYIRKLPKEESKVKDNKYKDVIDYCNEFKKNIDQIIDKLNSLSDNK